MPGGNFSDTSGIAGVASSASVRTPIDALDDALQDFKTGARAFTAINVDGGAIDGTPIGANSASTGKFTTLEATGAVVFNEAGADVDVRMEGDTNANLFFLDASTDRIGIGTATPESLLTVAGNLRQNATRPVLRLNDTGGETFAGILVWSRSGTDYAEFTYHPGEDKLVLYDAGTAARMGFHVGTGSLTLGGDTQTTNGPYLAFKEGSAPAALADHAVLFGIEVTGVTELRVKDSAGNTSTLSPHGPQMVDASGRLSDVVHKEYNPYTGIALELDIYGALEALEALTGKRFIHADLLPDDQMETWQRDDPMPPHLAAARAARKTLVEGRRP
jgi:hypothetical protein